MSFWRDHVPAGMKLRSPTSWHPDAVNEWTLPGRGRAGSRACLLKMGWNLPGVMGRGSVKTGARLPPRIQGKEVHLRPNTRITGGRLKGEGAVSVLLDYGSALLAYQVILATGYRVELAREPYLRNPGIVQALWVEEGYSVLDDQSSPASRAFTSPARRLPAALEPLSASASAVPPPRGLSATP